MSSTDGSFTLTVTDAASILASFVILMLTMVLCYHVYLYRRQLRLARRIQRSNASLYNLPKASVTSNNARRRSSHLSLAVIANTARARDAIAAKANERRRKSSLLAEQTRKKSMTIITDAPLPPSANLDNVYIDSPPIVRDVGDENPEDVTLINDSPEVALSVPGFYQCSFNTDYRVTSKLGYGGSAQIFLVDLLISELIQRAQGHGKGVAKILTGNEKFKAILTIKSPWMTRMQRRSRLSRKWQSCTCFGEVQTLCEWLDFRTVHL